MGSQEARTGKKNEKGKGRQENTNSEALVGGVEKKDEGIEFRVADDEWLMLQLQLQLRLDRGTDGARCCWAAGGGRRKETTERLKDCWQAQTQMRMQREMQHRRRCKVVQVAGSPLDLSGPVETCVKVDRATPKTKRAEARRTAKPKLGRWG